MSFDRFSSGWAAPLSERFELPAFGGRVESLVATSETAAASVGSVRLLLEFFLAAADSSGFVVAGSAPLFSSSDLGAATSVAGFAAVGVPLPRPRRGGVGRERAL